MFSYNFIMHNSDILIKSFIFFFINLLILLILLYFERVFFPHLNKKIDSNIQKIHNGNVSRLGGLAIVITSLISSINYFYSNDNLFFLIVLFGLPLIILALIEDLVQHINPLLRLAAITISSLLYLNLAIINLPALDIILISNFLNLPLISIIFYTLCLVTYINGVNFIDGTNGLASLSTLSSLICLLFIAFVVKDFEIIKILTYFIFILFAFILLNYPFGKIFLGDLGAYYLGWFTGIMTILLMSRNTEIPNWNAVLILCYPIIEVLASFIRKISKKINPIYPDIGHLHLRLFFILKNKLKNTKLANSLVAPCLMIIWFTPLALLPWVYLNKYLIFIGIFFQIIIYCSIYILVKDKD